MKNCIRLTFALALLCGALSSASYASSVYIVQGLAGRNYAARTDPAFPVDVLVNNEVCYEHGLPFGVIANPLTLFPGTYNVKVSIANTLAPCSETPLIDTELKIEPQTDISAVITLNSEGKPELLTFTNDLTPVPADSARVLFAHAANAPAVQVIFQNLTTMKSYTYTLNPGALLDQILPAGNYSISVIEGTTTLIPPTNQTLFSQSASLFYGLGQASNNTVVMEFHTLRTVI